MKSVRVLGLGNDLVADDGFGLQAAARLGQRFAGRVDVRSSACSGLDLLEEASGASHLLVMDTLLTGRARPGTVFEVNEGDIEAAPGSSPHYVGLFEALALGRAIGLEVPREVRILAVEPEDAFTIGGAMSAPVRDALDRVVDRAAAIVTEWLAGGTLTSAGGDCGNSPKESGNSHVDCH